MAVTKKVLYDKWIAGYPIPYLSKKHRVTPDWIESALRKYTPEAKKEQNPTAGDTLRAPESGRLL